MKVGLIGLAGVGKSTIFRALTGVEGAGRELRLGAVKVPDPRLERLAEAYKPDKVTPAEVVFVDFPGPRSREEFKASDLLKPMREADAMALVLRAFGPDANPVRELDDLKAEMILADLQVVENRQARLKKEKAREHEPELLERCRTALEKERSLAELDFAPEEESLLSGFGFLSRKPALAVFNTADDEAGKDLGEEYRRALAARGLEGLSIAGRLELELAELEPADREAFLKELGIAAPARDRFIRACYRRLRLVSFFTTAGREVRAWTVERGTPARRAAGKVHSDMERGFIRAEVIAYDDFLALGSEARCREAGRLRLEGRDYVVQDGDIIRFRFST
jgi:GTP-binding protein YchF